MKFSLGKQIMISEEASHILSPLIHKLVLCINAVKVLHSVCQQIWKTQQWTGKGQFSFQSQRSSDYCKIALISHTSKVMLKILQVHMNCELPNVQEGFKKMQRNQRSNCQHPLDHSKSKRVPEKKTSISALLTMTKPLTVWITINWEKF